MQRFNITGSTYTGQSTTSQVSNKGTVLQVAYGENTTSSTKVFSSRSVYEHVPGYLYTSLTRKSTSSYFVARAHIHWGGFNASIDVAPLFRVYYGNNLTDTNRVLGPLWQSGRMASNTSVTHGVNAGHYRYGKGDNNSSSEVDFVLTSGAVDTFLAYEGLPIYFAVKWACGYEANSRTLYWNRSINSGNAYNPIHTCGFTITEVEYGS